MNIDMEDILKKLSKERPIFHSEDDFKFSLCWKIKETYKGAEIGLEVPIIIDENSDPIYLDILVIYKNKWIPIELKYKTKPIKYTSLDFSLDHFDLSNQQAYNKSCYKYLRDIKHIEDIKNKYDECEEGYAIFLTNDLHYKKGPNKTALYYNFSLKDSLTKEGILKYQKENKDYPDIELSGSYTIEWKEYHTLNTDAKNNEFIYNIAKIPNE